jgi:hypothetical protein
VKGGPTRLRKKKEPSIAEHPTAGAAAHTNHAGILRFEDEHLHLPEGLAEAGDTEAEGLLPGRVVIVITLLAIIYIVIIAWFVSQLPER